MLQTYEDLKAAVARTANRKDAAFIEAVPDFVAMAEAEMRRDINARSGVQILDLSIDSDSYPLPCGFDGLVSINGRGANSSLTFVSQNSIGLDRGWSGYGAATYTISGDTIYFGRVPGDVRLAYKSLFAPLGRATRCNWILSNHPDAYLYGALKHSAPYLEDDARLGTWQALYSSAIQAINTQALEQTFSGPLRIQSGYVDGEQRRSNAYIPTEFGGETGAGSIPVDFLSIYNEARN